MTLQQSVQETTFFDADTPVDVENTPVDVENTPVDVETSFKWFNVRHCNPPITTLWILITNPVIHYWL
jgi:hypothetical protein